uniref:Uncharacterized protein n=1 Tax=Craspedostauros australis TaxID=1486917 RepID=A0A7R9WQW5_9STRA|eukprot:CAMPEP_0198119786 /NCGR_PEP_ID=MMETSP1442-20131203/26972_1 /TAXON_ID= /ORGANISM="Craspedostauros australis, Strain CCMP3328" /LENGTH=413 /DNA_ID=CAMNT_0043778323 /DNA_START=35 /DNA_END=1276 /DNA_ORIENTATION=+
MQASAANNETVDACERAWKVLKCEPDHEPPVYEGGTQEKQPFMPSLRTPIRCMDLTQDVWDSIQQRGYSFDDLHAFAQKWSTVQFGNDLRISNNAFYDRSHWQEVVRTRDKYVRVCVRVRKSVAHGHGEITAALRQDMAAVLELISQCTKPTGLRLEGSMNLYREIIHPAGIQFTKMELQAIQNVVADDLLEISSATTNLHINYVSFADDGDSLLTQLTGFPSTLQELCINNSTGISTQNMSAILRRAKARTIWLCGALSFEEELECVCANKNIVKIASVQELRHRSQLLDLLLRVLGTDSIREIFFLSPVHEYHLDPDMINEIYDKTKANKVIQHIWVGTFEQMLKWRSRIVPLLAANRLRSRHIDRLQELVKHGDYLSNCLLVLQRHGTLRRDADYLFEMLRKAPGHLRYA